MTRKEFLASAQGSKLNANAMKGVQGKTPTGDVEVVIIAQAEDYRPKGADFTIPMVQIGVYPKDSACGEEERGWFGPAKQSAVNEAVLLGDDEKAWEKAKNEGTVFHAHIERVPLTMAELMNRAAGDNRTAKTVFTAR